MNVHEHESAVVGVCIVESDGMNRKKYGNTWGIVVLDPLLRDHMRPTPAVVVRSTRSSLDGLSGERS